MHAAEDTGWGAAARAALPVWFGSRLAVALASIAGVWTIGAANARDVPGFLAIWDRWDVGLFRKVAEFGYFSPEYDDGTEVDFPALPLLLRLVHLVVPDWIAAGILVSLVAGAVAAMALWRLSAADDGSAAGSRALLYLILFPYAVFLFPGYSEALFLAFAVPSWLMARQGRWMWAGLLAGGAAFTRVTGLCLAAGLGIEYLVQRRRAGRPWPRLLGWDVLWLSAPLLSVAGYFTYLHSRTGDWNAYGKAQLEGWGRDFPVSPITSFRNTLDLAQQTDIWSAFTWHYRAEMAAVGLGVVVVALLLRAGRWGEATYVGTSTLMLMMTTYYASSVRAALLWFPMYLLLARATVARDWLHRGVVWVSAPLMVTFVVAFTHGSWLG